MRFCLYMYIFLNYNMAQTCTKYKNLQLTPNTSDQHIISFFQAFIVFKSQNISLINQQLRM